MAECLSQYLCNQNIAGNIKEDCENQMFSGMSAQAWIINFAAVNKLAGDVDADNPRVIKRFTLRTNSGDVFTIINARNNPFTGTSTTVEVGDYRNTFTRTVSLFVPMDGPEVSRDILDPLANGRFIVVLRNNYISDNGDNEFQVYGYDRGLVVSSMSQTKYENNDYWVVELQETGVPNSGKFLVHNTDVDAFQTTDGQFHGATITGAGNIITFNAAGGGVIGQVNLDDYIEMGATSYVGPVRLEYGGKTYRIDVNIPTLGSYDEATITNATYMENAADYLCGLLPIE